MGNFFRAWNRLNRFGSPQQSRFSVQVLYPLLVFRSSEEVQSLRKHRAAFRAALHHFGESANLLILTRSVVPITGNHCETLRNTLKLDNWIFDLDKAPLRAFVCIAKQ